MVDWDCCQKTLGVSFRQKLLLEHALVHSSYCNENPGFRCASNERLEFLGDAVLGLVVTAKLFKEFPELSEGELTEIRASLVCRDTLAELASSLQLGDWLVLGRGEELSGGRAKARNLASAMEALVGALYLDQGLARARAFILGRFKRQFEQIRKGETIPNYKALLQEFVQGQGKGTPLYRLVETTGPDHNRRFTVEILVDGQTLGQGVGATKKIAEGQAARMAWEGLRCSHGQTRL